MHVIRAPRVVADSVPLGPACVAVSDGVIVGVVAGETYGGVRPDVDLPSGVLVPGLVDMQINGCFGVDFVAADPAGWADGVAGGCRRPGSPRSCRRSSPRRCRTSSRRCAGPRHCPRDLGGARVLGVHVEGPFLAPTGTARTTRRCCATPPRRRSTR